MRERDAYAQDLIASRIDEARLSPEDRAFATRLVLGVVSAVGTLDEIVDRSLRSPTDVQDDVR
ncbi:MAG: transcription antitermination factor NusB, partial [Gordonibacter sp.]